MRRVLLLAMVLVLAGCGGSSDSGDGGDDQPTGQQTETTASGSTTGATTTTSAAEPGLPRYEGSIPALPLIRHEDFPEVIANAGVVVRYAETGIAAVAPSDYPLTYTWHKSGVNLIGTLFANEPNYEYMLFTAPIIGEQSNADPDVVVSVGSLTSAEQPPTLELLAGLGYTVESNLEPVALTNGESSPVYVGIGRYGPSYTIVDGAHFVALQVDDACGYDDSQRADNVPYCLTWGELQQLFDSFAVVAPDSLGWSS